MIMSFYFFGSSDKKNILFTVSAKADLMSIHIVKLFFAPLFYVEKLYF